jgi:hypothetical protein
VLVTLGMVVVAPLGLARLRTPGLSRLRAIWPLLGLLAGLALLLPRGGTAVALVLPYAAACATVTGCGLHRAARARTWRSPERGAGRGIATPGEAVRELTALTAAGSLSVAALSLVAERAGVELLGFSLAVHGLTVAHFHFAGFAAALLAGLTAAAAPGRVSSVGACAVPAGTLIVALGHFTGRWTELAGAVVLTVGLLSTSWVAGRHVRLPDAAARVLLRVAAVATPVSMLLAVHFALGRATGIPHLSIAETAATHGVLNALGVGLCGLLAWHRAGGVRL